MSDGRNAAVQIVSTLQQQGHTAYLAGGCVRDRLLGTAPKDYDVATDAKPDTVRKLFSRSKHVGEAFGVVLVQLMGSQIEVATFRTEWGYQDGRRPSHITFTDAQHDAQRRDFTVNGLFEDPMTGTIIDFVAGRADLKARVIRAIGDPEARFGEDYLRLLRAARFAASLVFEIEPRTAEAIRHHAAKLADISRERIGLEVQSMLTGPRPAMAARLVQQLHLDQAVLDEGHSSVMLSTIDRLRAGTPYPFVLAAWLLDRQDTAKLDWCADERLTGLVRRWRRALCLSNEDRDAMRACLAMLPQLFDWPQLSIARRKRMLASPAYRAAFSLLCALDRSDTTELRRVIEQESKPLIEQGVAPEPLVTGDDLIEMGHQPGPAFRRRLDGVYDAQLEGTVRTRDEAISWLKWIHKSGQPDR